MKKNLKVVLFILLILVVLSVTWYLASPLFVDKVVNEEHPFEVVVKEMPKEEISESILLEQNLTKEDNTTIINEAKEEVIEEESTVANIDLIGSFTDADSFHKVSGMTKVISNQDKKFLRFENFESTNGPDLFVYLATDERATDFISLGELKGNIGDQNYELDNSIDLEKYNKVLIWCKQFGVLFGSSELN